MKAVQTIWFLHLQQVSTVVATYCTLCYETLFRNCSNQFQIVWNITTWSSCCNKITSDVGYWLWVCSCLGQLHLLHHAFPMEQCDTSALVIPTTVEVLSEAAAAVWCCHTYHWGTCHGYRVLVADTGSCRDHLDHFGSLSNGLHSNSLCLEKGQLEQRTIPLWRHYNDCLPQVVPTGEKQPARTSPGGSAGITWTQNGAMRRRFS